ncbi:MAG: HupE/UreJ family protein [Planctomycetota bacterium]
MTTAFQALRKAFIFSLWFSLLPVLAWAHAPGENYVWVNIDNVGISGRFEIHIDDLKEKLGVDIEKDGLDKTAATVHEYIRQHFAILIEDREIEFEFEKTGLFEENAKYAQYFYRTVDIDVPDKISIRNDIFIEYNDPLHRSLIVLEYNRKIESEYGAENAVMVFGPHNPLQELDLTDIPSLLKPKEFIWQGVLHIWIGLDHILFLLALLLMAVMVVNPRLPSSLKSTQTQSDDTNPVNGNENQNELGPSDSSLTAANENVVKPVSGFARAFWNVLKIVTIFTVAHSITLSLAALRLIEVNSQFVESLIALSIVIVAINNIFPRFNDKRWIVIFFFGLFHGMGFASVMGVLPFRTIHLIKVLLGFNIGVELGQLAIVFGIFPVIYLLRNTKFYRYGVLIGGSFLIGVLAIYWFVERAFGL